MIEIPGHLRVAIRADASLQIGSGQVMRGQANFLGASNDLLEELKRSDHASYRGHPPSE